MQNLDDNILLREYVEHGSEEAFATIVSRHIDKIYSVALRHTGNRHSAEEITQAVFVILIKRSSRLGSGVILSGWLYHTARLVSLTYVRGEIRRKRREQEAYLQSERQQNELDDWMQISAMLDAAIAALSEPDRHAIVLRFFDGKSMKDVGTALGSSEDAAKMRVNRAVEKLRLFFCKRGITTSGPGLAAAISTHGVQAAPMTLAKAVTSIALTRAAAPTSTLTLVKAALKFMAWTKTQTTVIAGVVAIIAIGTTTISFRVHSVHSREIEDCFTHLDSLAYLRKAPPLIVLRPSRYSNDPEGDCVISEDGQREGEGKLMRRDCTFSEVLASAYGIDETRMVFPSGVPAGRFDLLLTTTNRPLEALRLRIKKQFGYSGHSELLATNVLVLRLAGSTASLLKRNTVHGGAWDKRNNGECAVSDFKMGDVARLLGTDYFEKPVVDETELVDSYDFDIHWERTADLNAQKQGLIRALREQAGLELVPAQRAIEMLVVDKVNK